MKPLKKFAFLFALISSSTLVACGDSNATSADNIEYSSSSSESFIESSCNELSSSSFSSSSEKTIKSSSSSKIEEVSSSSKELHPWPSDSLKKAFGGDYIPVLTADNSVDFHFERRNGDFQYAVTTSYNKASESGYTDSLKAAKFEMITDPSSNSPYFEKYVDHKIFIVTYGGRDILFKYYDVSTSEFPAEMFSAKNKGAELPEIKKADGYHFDLTKNILVVAGTEENFREAYSTSLKTFGFKTENDTSFEKVDIEGKYILSVSIHELGVGNAYELRLKYQDLSDYAYYRMPENFKVTYQEQSSAYVQQNTLYRDGKKYYYTSSLKYTSPATIETNSSIRFKFDETSGVWLEYINETLKDSLSELKFIRVIVEYTGLTNYWTIFDTDVKDFSDQGVVNYKVKTNISGLECHKWTAEKRSDTVEKIICSADDKDYLLSQKNSSSTKSIGISEFEIGGVEVPAKAP